jgi:hypothetical protein
MREIMPALEPFYYLLHQNSKKLTKNEVLFTEVIFFLQLQQLISQTTVYHRHDKDSIMIDHHFVKQLLEDILVTEEYTLTGIAYHLNIPEDVLADILTGCNQSPSLSIARRIMELHKFIRRDLYQDLIRKIALDATTLTPYSEHLPHHDLLAAQK